ncbi:glyoxalase-like domain-domain-containing protein [Naematelia encephala]|uniref:Glyoxalase-like domain-domain-containing protein n=1 Tax=Naematelia encephala TaxID=71784 RepID=A0A1Y2AVW4_9TREE|nr:glyoxalase-like domain-domain-containing protein [Naematelia encephala]
MPDSLPTPQLDHIVIHVPYAYLSSPPSWLTELFTITPGGTHADGLTANALVPFSDGTYLELIAFTPEITAEQKRNHMWGGKPYGIIDWALTLPKKDDQGNASQYQILRKRWLDLPVPPKWKSSELRQGGRTKPDGTKLEWLIAFPPERGVTPFWCLDVTARSHRVSSAIDQITHPSGVQGIAEVSLNLPQGGITSEIKPILDAAVPQSEDRVDDYTWSIGTPAPTENGPGKVYAHSARIRITQESIAKDETRLGVTELIFWTRDKGNSSVEATIDGDKVSFGFVTG